MMLQQDAPGDYVLATGETHTVREFVDVTFRELACRSLGGRRRKGTGCRSGIGQGLGCGGSEYYRPTEVELLIGDATKAREKLGWVPRRGSRIW